MSTTKKFATTKATKATKPASTKSATPANPVAAKPVSASVPMAKPVTPVATKPAQRVAQPVSAPVKQTTTKVVRVEITQEAIAQRAWDIWQGEGCPEGRETDHWMRAERELRS